MVPTTESRSPLHPLFTHIFHSQQNEQSDLDFFSPKPKTATCSPSDRPDLQPSATLTGSTQAPLPSRFQAPVVPASVSAPKAGILFPNGLAPASASNVQPTAPVYHGSALGDSTLHQLDALDQLLEEAKV